MNRLLITGGTTSYALRVMKLLSNNFNISLASANEIPTVLSKKITLLPTVSSNSFVNQTLKIALENDYNYILPLEEREIIKLSQNLTIFTEYGIKIIAPNFEELRSLHVTKNPNNTVAITILIDGIDILNNKKTKYNFSGIGNISDDTFTITVAE